MFTCLPGFLWRQHNSCCHLSFLLHWLSFLIGFVVYVLFVPWVLLWAKWWCRYAIPFVPRSCYLLPGVFKTSCFRIDTFITILFLCSINNTFVVWHHGLHNLYTFLELLNAINKTIKFTMELQHNGCLLFLDRLVVRKPDASLGRWVYEKPPI